ncbi:hypothetical protein ONZ45_g19404 [Pleurotus djamor]|nr:hypothetical protein ONZ45_g19404 [Pleurotus djamor]
MSTLILPSKITPYKDTDESSLTFARVVIPSDRDHPAPNHVYRVEELKAIYTGHDTTVFRVILHSSKSKNRGPFRVVLKMDVEARFPRDQEYRKEFENYLAVFDLQGKIIPVCFGLFQAVAYGKLVSVLVLEDCGEPVQYENEEMALDPRKSVFLLLKCLHEFGYEHGNVSPRNVLVNGDGHIFLIDLEDIQRHECHAAPIVTIGDFTPSLEEFGCIELHRLARHLDFWEPSTIDFYGFDIPVRVFEAGAQKVLDCLPEYFRRSERDKAILLKEAEIDIARIKEIRASVAILDEPAPVVEPSSASVAA